jgi:hypothetical protein
MDIIYTHIVIINPIEDDDMAFFNPLLPTVVINLRPEI